MQEGQNFLIHLNSVCEIRGPVTHGHPILGGTMFFATYVIFLINMYSDFLSGATKFWHLVDPMGHHCLMMNFTYWLERFSGMAAPAQSAMVIIWKVL